MNAPKLSAALYVIVMLAMTFAALLLAASSGRADHRPYIMPDGRIVHGDWGLYRPGHVVPWVQGPIVYERMRTGVGAFFPSNRDDPGAYHMRPPEKGGIIPPEPYSRTWGAQSEPYDPTRATFYAPFAPPAVIYAPRVERDRKDKDEGPGDKDGPKKPEDDFKYGNGD